MMSSMVKTAVLSNTASDSDMYGLLVGGLIILLVIMVPLAIVVGIVRFIWISLKIRIMLPIKAMELGLDPRDEFNRRYLISQIMRNQYPT
jgi:hypothetical protein